MSKKKDEMTPLQIIEETKNTLLHVQRENLSILHAFIPFVTEELWKLTDFRKLEKTDLINFNFIIS